MRDFLAKMLGKKVDLYCGGSSSLRGEIIRVEDEVLHLKDDEQKMCFVAIDKIIAIWEARDADHHAGFVSNFLNNK